MEDTNQIKESILEFLLIRHLLGPADFTTQQLEEEIDQFDAFVQDPKNADYFDTTDALKAFCEERVWTDSLGTNHNICAAIYNGWLMQKFRTVGIKNLLLERDERGEWVYKYQCTKCRQPYSQFQFDRLQEKKCPSCYEGELKKIRKRNQFWLLDRTHRIAERTQGPRSGEIPVTLEQLQQFDKAMDCWDKNIAPDWEKLKETKFPSSQDYERFSYKARPYMEKILNALPIETKLCALPECLNRIPYGSRSDRIYCSERCRSIAKTRRARALRQD